VKLKQLYSIPGKTVVTAHRGFSACYPENTLAAFSKAVEIGVDIVEFDVRETKDHQLVILHDPTVDRTTDGKGAIEDWTWEDAKALNATYWQGMHRDGQRLDHAAGDEGIPLFSDALALLRGKAGINIQVYTSTTQALEKIVDLYLAHGLEDSAYLMLRTFDDACHVRSISRRVALCVGEERTNIERHIAFGVDFMQPMKHSLKAPLIKELHACGIPYNIFYANTEEEMTWMMERKIRGIMTDAPHRLLALIESRKGEKLAPGLYRPIGPQFFSK